MKATKYNGTRYQLDESKFKPACIKFDQDMFDDEIFPVLFGLGFEVEIQGSRYFLVNNYDYVNLRFSRSHYSYNRLECYTAQQFLEASGIFAVAEELPKDWYIEVTEENLQELDTWRKSVAKDLSHRLEVGWFVMSKHHRDESNCFGGYECHLIEYHPNHKKIDLETFRKITNMKKSFTITAEQAQSIIDIACDAWKKKLAEKWANNIVLGDEIEVSEEFYKEMRSACTAPQNELFDKIFGKDDDSVDLSMLNKSEFDSTAHGMIQVRAGNEHRNKAFFLSEGFNWEIKRDSEGLLCLIPTKKK